MGKLIGDNKSLVEGVEQTIFIQKMIEEDDAIQTEANNRINADNELNQTIQNTATQLRNEIESAEDNARLLDKVNRMDGYLDFLPVVIVISSNDDIQLYDYIDRPYTKRCLLRNTSGVNTPAVKLNGPLYTTGPYAEAIRAYQPNTDYTLYYELNGNGYSIPVRTDSRTWINVTICTLNADSTSIFQILDIV